MGRSNVHQTRLLGFLVLALGVMIALPKLRSEEGTPTATCPQPFPQTLLAANLLWNPPSMEFVAQEPSPVLGHHPDDLRLLEGEADAVDCARIGTAIPDSLKPLGLFAPRFTAYYALGDLYVVPIVPRITPQEIEAEVRGERMIDKVGVTFVFDEELNVLAAVEN